MLSRSFILPNAVWILGGAFGIWVVFQLWGRTKGGRRVLDTMKLKVPLFGDIQRKSAIARFSRPSEPWSIQGSRFSRLSISRERPPETS